jgi:hypothetical protein
VLASLTILSLRSVVYVKENMEVEYADASKKASSEAANLTTALTQSCLGTVSDFSASNVNSTIDSFLACYEKGLTEIFKENNEEISYQAKALTHVANLLENYTCADESLTTTHSNDIRNWEHNGTSHDAHILHERPDSQIRLVTNFITPEECKAFEAAAARLLHRGTVANGNDGSRLSENHKAWQAGIRVPWEKEADGNHIAQYTRRMYAYANHATGYNMDVAGQEDMMSIQYFGQNGKHPPGSTFSEKTPDRYTPHCDGNCEGLPHRNGARVATMVSYCTAPTRGGSTHFQHAGVHVKPKVGSAAFFSYMNPESRLMDTGWTTHSGCPVIEGTKRIVVHWMRVGVSAETPWDSLNTLNIPKHMVEEFA